MKPIDFPEANKKLVPAVGDEDKVFSMYFYHDHVQHRFISKWGLSEEELAHVNKTKAIWHSFTAFAPPPQILMADSPFDDSIRFEKREKAVSDVMDLLQFKDATVLLGVNTEFITMTMDEFEYAIGKLPMMEQEKLKNIQQVAKTTDTIVLGLPMGRMLIVRR